MKLKKVKKGTSYQTRRLLKPGALKVYSTWPIVKTTSAACWSASELLLELGLNLDYEHCCPL